LISIFKEERMEDTIKSDTSQVEVAGNTGKDGNGETTLSAPEERTAEIEQVLKQKEGEILALQTNMKSLETKVKGLDEALSAAIASYRTLMVQANPQVLTELISGDSVIEIDDSAKRAKEIIARIKRGVEAEFVQERFPVGAPGRGGMIPDLTSREKIQQGISRS
jgi:hypothetical protein